MGAKQSNLQILLTKKESDPLSKILEKAKEKSSVAGFLGLLGSLGLGFSQGLIDPISTAISALVSIYLIVVDEKKK
jgi:energy-converting hydrogenase Eha subunit C